MPPAVGITMARNITAGLSMRLTVVHAMVRIAAYGRAVLLAVAEILAAAGALLMHLRVFLRTLSADLAEMSVAADVAIAAAAFLMLLGLVILCALIVLFAGRRIVRGRVQKDYSIIMIALTFILMACLLR